jgi:hypothetical protein
MNQKEQHPLFPINKSQPDNGDKQKVFEKLISNLTIINQYQDLSLAEFKTMINELDSEEKVNKDLLMIIDYLLQLTSSIGICQKMTPGSEFYNYHRKIIDCLNSFLTKHTWFNELKEKDNRFSFSETKKNKSNSNANNTLLS